MPRELIAFFTTATAFDWILPGIAAGVWLIAILHAFFFRLRVALVKPPEAPKYNHPMSVVMVERNEEENLARNLPGWLSLNYSDYEVVVVDDFSEDNSLTTLGVMRVQFPRLKMTGLKQETRFSQKLARNLAMKAVTNEKVVFATPAMVMPHPQWLPNISAAFENGKKAVIGYVATNPAKGFFHQLFRIESFFQQADSMAFCLNGLPWVACEENVAFLRQSYFNVNGFAGKMQEEYLNMEAIFNSIFRRKGTAVLPLADSALKREIIARKGDYSELIRKFFILRRELGFGKRVVMWFFNLIRMAVVPLFIICFLVFPVLWLLAAIMLLLLLFLSALSIKLIQRRLNEPGIFLSSLIYGLIAPWYRMLVRWQFDNRRRNR